MAAPVAYIRRSVSRRGDPGDTSRQFQTDKVRALANGDGPTLRIIDQDWGRSAATDKTDRRLAFLALLDSIERGEVTTLYAYSADRLARSVQWSARLLDAAERAGTTIVTGEGRFAPGDDMARQMFHFQAMMNEGALRQMTAKSNDVAKSRRERGDTMGRAPYGYKHAMVDGVSTLVPREGEDPQIVVDAFVEAGSFNEAAKLLNGAAGQPVVNDSGRILGIGRGLPTRFPGKKWDPTTVQHVVLRWDKQHGTALVPVRTRRGATTRSVRLFAGLLRCPHWERHPDTAILTSSSTSWGRRYYCRVAHFDPDHPRPYILAESKVLDWAKREIETLGKRFEVELAGETPNAEAKVASLEARRERVGDALLNGIISTERAKRELAAIDAEMPALESGRRAIKAFRLRGQIDWNADPATINGELRNLWQYVDLDPATMEPVAAAWMIGQSPEERERHEAWMEARVWGQNHGYGPDYNPDVDGYPGTSELETAVARAKRSAGGPTAT